eukprot:2816868-Amphidinium_carterae.1
MLRRSFGFVVCTFCDFFETWGSGRLSQAAVALLEKRTAAATEGFPYPSRKVLASSQGWFLVSITLR